MRLDVLISKVRSIVNPDFIHGPNVWRPERSSVSVQAPQSVSLLDRYLEQWRAFQFRRQTFQEAYLAKIAKGNYQQYPFFHWEGKRYNVRYTGTVGSNYHTLPTIFKWQEKRYIPVPHDVESWHGGGFLHPDRSGHYHALMDERQSLKEKITALGGAQYL